MRMRKLGVLVVALACCRSKPAAPVQEDTGVAATAPAPDAAKAAIRTLKDVINEWNSAHVRHDARALEALYAPNVDFYGQKLTNVACAKRKEDAFAKSPDYSQSVTDLEVEVLDGGTSVLAEFLKTTRTRGKTDNFLASLVIGPDLRIAAETDRTSEAHLKYAGMWCRDENGLKDKVIPPFKISAREAEQRVTQSKRYAELMVLPQLMMVEWPKRCPSTCKPEPRACGYDMSLVYGIPSSDPLGATSYMELAVYVDAVTGDVWIEEGDGRQK